MPASYNLLVEPSSSKSYFDLRTIAEDIKTLVPLEAVLPTEQINHSKMDDVSHHLNCTYSFFKINNYIFKYFNSSI